MSDTTTRGVRVEVKTTFVPERSSPEENHYFFAYRIRISNVGDETAITDSYLTDDSSGLFRNIFLTDPQTYGLRVSQAF